MLLELIYFLLFLAATVYLIGLYLNGNKNFWPDRGVDFLDLSQLVPFHKRLTLGNSSPEQDSEVYAYFKGKKYGGYMESRTPVLFVRDLDFLKQILVKDFDHFAERRSLNVGKADPLQHRMLTELKGKEWKDMRGIMSPTFTTGKIRRMFDMFNTSGRHLADYVKRKMEENNSIVDCQDCFGRFTMDVISSVAFGLQSDTFQNDASIFRKMAKKLGAFGPLRILKVMLYMLTPSIANALKLKISEPESSAFFSAIATQAIAVRKKDLKNGVAAKRTDFIQLLVQAQFGQLKADQDDTMDSYERDAMLPSDDSGGAKTPDALDDATVISQCLLFFQAGADTLESLLTFCAYELAINPEVQEKLAREVSDTINKNGDLSYDTTHAMEYLDMVICETLRLHPPAYKTERACIKEYLVPGTKDLRLPKNTVIIVPIFSIHYDEKYYPQPTKFNPDNFSQQNKEGRHPYAFLPFGQGPRNCIGMRFALTEAKAALAHLVHNFKIEPSAKTQIPIEVDSSSFILKPKKGMHLKFSPRYPSN